MIRARWPGRPEGAERGQSLSVFAIVIIAAMIMTAGLVIDGGQKVQAVSRAESVAAAAARVGSDAGATRSLAGQPNSAVAVDAANAYLRASGDGLTGSASVAAGQVVVHTEITRPTLFLSLINIGTVTGTGDASAELVGSQGR